METSTALIKGFFAGFVAAQFISGWISGPLIVVFIFISVFSARALERIQQYAERFFSTWTLLQKVGLVAATVIPVQEPESMKWTTITQPPSFGPPV